MRTQALKAVQRDPVWVRMILIGIAFSFLAFFLGMPLVVIAINACRDGLHVYAQSLRDPDAVSAILLTLKVVAIAVPCNAIFGIAAAWLIAKFQFRGKQVLLGLIDMPFSVSPIIAGLLFVLAFGSNTLLGGWLMAHGVRVIFSSTGIVLATVFVTLPFVARELIPLMQSQGIDEEEAAMTMGASGWQVFARVTLPNIKWGLWYGITLSTARAVGEFGAVSVVSGHIRGLTNTISLHVEILYNEYNFSAAFALSSLMVLFAFGTLVVKIILEGKRST